MNPVHYSSQTDEHGTPPYVVEWAKRHHNIALDVCATPGRQVCERYFSPSDNGLAQDWAAHLQPGEAAWMNPPYGRAIGEWVAKAARAGCRVVALLPARTDTAWWHDYVMPVLPRVTFLRGRLRFTDAAGVEQGPAPFPSVIVVFG